MIRNAFQNSKETGQKEGNEPRMEERNRREENSGKLEETKAINAETRRINLIR